jgi:hypothetical protein
MCQFALPAGVPATRVPEPAAAEGVPAPTPAGHVPVHSGKVKQSRPDYGNLTQEEAL